MCKPYIFIKRDYYQPNQYNAFGEIFTGDKSPRSRHRRGLTFRHEFKDFFFQILNGDYAKRIRNKFSEFGLRYFLFLSYLPFLYFPLYRSKVLSNKLFNRFPFIFAVYSRRYLLKLSNLFSRNNRILFPVNKRASTLCVSEVLL